MNRRQLVARAVAATAGTALVREGAAAAVPPSAAAEIPGLLPAAEMPGAVPESEIQRARFPEGFIWGAYHAWSLLDNFQWAEGHTERYGLIYTDFRSQERTIKDSGYWYGRVAAANRLDV